MLRPPALIAAAAVDGGTADAASGTGGTGGAQPLVRPADEDFTKGVNMRFQDEMPLLVATEVRLWFLLLAGGRDWMGGGSSREEAQPSVRPADEDFTKGVNMRFWTKSLC